MQTVALAAANENVGTWSRSALSVHLFLEHHRIIPFRPVLPLNGGEYWCNRGWREVPVIRIRFRTKRFAGGKHHNFRVLIGLKWRHKDCCLCRGQWEQWHSGLLPFERSCVFFWCVSFYGSLLIVGYCVFFECFSSSACSRHDRALFFHRHWKGRCTTAGPTSLSFLFNAPSTTSSTSIWAAVVRLGEPLWHDICPSCRARFICHLNFSPIDLLNKKSSPPCVPLGERSGSSEAV